MGTLWYGGKIYTMEQEGHTVEAVFVKDGYIRAVGQLDEIKETYKDDIKEKQNLHGATMYPGFVDSHGHMIGHGEKLLRLDLSTANSAEEMKVMLKDAVANTPDGEWVYGEGWNENNFPDRKIFHRDELDEIAPNHPVMLTRVCRHAILVNTKALTIAGITNETENPQGGVIVRDDEGVATGFLLDQAQDLVKKAAPEASENYLNRALETAYEDLVSLGLVGLHTEDLNYYSGFHNTYQAIIHAINGEDKKFRANLLVHHEVVDDMHKEGHQFESGTPYVTFGAMKIFADGAIGGRTALLSHPYNDSPETSGVAIHEKEELFQLIKKARNYKMPVAIHTIGDLAAEYAIEAFELYPPIAGQRDRLIHGQFLNKDLMDRLEKLAIVIDIQPQFVASDFPWVIERIGEERLPYAYAWKMLLNRGIHCAGGSDTPIESANPLLGIHAAVARRSVNETHEGYNPEEKLSIFEAISLYTIGSAYAIGKEDSRGKIAEGHVADFTVYANDLFETAIDEIPNSTVQMTVVDNTIVYKR
ncbi:amidohydrolase [Lottiidibacillus patelloidae]|uniref:Amidohydrolase n=1 Tax=Lottiidibacillus patelloidae TaxID=2670334 RepID=A0A263BR54_9BACI|nr:amidohydrolase [Lottiidibacillus patelloidae]OZM56052.1 amidohydrolase [Lottiidibacillus patelloidae]